MTDVAAPADVARVTWSRAQWWVVGASVLVGLAVRWLLLGHTLATFDESFTAMAARRGVGDLPEFLRDADSHPPLDYLIRHLVVGTGDTTWLRLPSAVFGTATLLVVVWWMRNRGWFGVFVVALTSVAAIQVLYARQARMYALVILAGTVVAAVAERWIDERRVRWSVLAAAALTVALFSHTAALLLAGGALLVPGLARDRAAWVWRACILGPVALWGVVWGPSMIHQAEHDPASWIPYTTVRTALESVAGQVSLYNGLAFLVVVAVAAGGVRLVQHQPALGRVWLCLFVVPSAALIVLGLDRHLLLPRSLAFAAWGPVLALAALVAACVEDRPRWLTPPVAVAGVLVGLVLAVPSVVSAVRYREDSVPVREHLNEVARPGDTIAVSPAFLAPMLQWDHDLSPSAGPSDLLADDEVWSATLPGAAPTGRLWLVVPDTYAYEPPASFVPCSASNRWHAGDLSLWCYEAGTGSAGSG